MRLTWTLLDILQNILRFEQKGEKKVRKAGFQQECPSLCFKSNLENDKLQEALL